MRTIPIRVFVSLLALSWPALAQSVPDANKEVRIVGCVQWEKATARKDDEYVLTKVHPEGARKATTYRIAGDRAKELGRRLGQQVEVIGMVEEADKDVPRIQMTAWVPLKDSCGD